MIFQNLPTAFPWYNKIEKQVRNKAGGKYDVPALISPNNAILPFMFRRPTSGQLPLSWILYDIDGNIVTDLSQYIVELGRRSLEGSDYFWMSRNSAMAIGDPGELVMLPGCYYCEMVFPTGLSQVSEVFTVPEDSFKILEADPNKYLTIEWTNTQDIPPIFYPTSDPVFVQRVYLDSRITSSEPELESEVEKNGNNIDIPIFQRAVIKYRITALVSDFLKIALCTLPMHDSVTLITEGGLESGVMENIEIDSNPEDGGFISQVDILFEDDLLMISKDCPDGLVRDACPGTPSGINHHGSLTENPGYYTMYATLPTNISGADIILYPSANTVAFATRMQLASGFLYPVVAGETGFGLRVRSFNCIITVTGIYTF